MAFLPSRPFMVSIPPDVRQAYWRSWLGNYCHMSGRLCRRQDRTGACRSNLDLRILKMPRKPTEPKRPRRSFGIAICIVDSRWARSYCCNHIRSPVAALRAWGWGRSEPKRPTRLRLRSSAEVRRPKNCWMKRNVLSTDRRSSRSDCHHRRTFGIDGRQDTMRGIAGRSRTPRTPKGPKGPTKPRKKPEGGTAIGH